MPYLKTYDLFLSHSWRYNSDYYRLIGLLRNASYFKFRDYSVPIHRPKVDPNSSASVRFVTGELEKQIKPVNCVLLMAGVYSTHSDWIHREVNLAIKYNKPIIITGIKPCQSTWYHQLLLGDTMVSSNCIFLLSSVPLPK